MQDIWSPSFQSLIGVDFDHLRNSRRRVNVGKTLHRVPIFTA